MKARVIETGEIIEVEEMLEAMYHDVATSGIDERNYYASDLDFDLSEPEEEAKIGGWVARDEVDKTAAKRQALSHFSDDDLKQELKRRENELRSRFPENVRCRDCKHCGAGKTYRHTYMAVTVCLAKPKPKAGPDCYYATSLSSKVCGKFEPKSSNESV